ncbi:ComEA family DNA-binding protein [Tundrisphaera lichenicola]|uniref:ComEA family DNA-binding protein n=1 Tax=Tundrisphaera lichenicola TaxID=2029860 RepID=UPI003EC05029
MPNLDRPPWGWNGPARGLLILLASMSGGILTGVSSSPSRSVIGPPALRIDPNTAPAPVLGVLPGIGPVLARRIVDARDVSNFGTIDDLDRRVKGIGPAKVELLRPFLRLDRTSPHQP